jgi:hypothetical protein
VANLCERVLTTPSKVGGWCVSFLNKTPWSAVERSTSWLLETENIGVVADIGVDRDPSIVRHGR